MLIKIIIFSTAEKIEITRSFNFMLSVYYCSV